MANHKKRPSHHSHPSTRLQSREKKEEKKNEWGFLARSTVCRKKPPGYGSELNHQRTAGFGPCFHLPGFHLGPILTHCHLTSRTRLESRVPAWSSNAVTTTSIPTPASTGARKTAPKAPAKAQPPKANAEALSPVNWQVSHSLKTRGSEGVRDNPNQWLRISAFFFLEAWFWVKHVNTGC